MKASIVYQDRYRYDEECVHFSFRPSYADMNRVLENSPNLKFVQMPASYFNTLSRNLKDLCNDHGVAIISGNEKGRRTDLDRTINVMVPGETYKIPGGRLCNVLRIDEKLVETTVQGKSGIKIFTRNYAKTNFIPIEDGFHGVE